MMRAPSGGETAAGVSLPIRSRPALPKYFQLKQVLREQIAQLEPGDAVPSEAELCQAHRISRTTVRKALNDLAQEGLVYTIQGKGTFVASKKLPSAWVLRTGGLYADMTERGHTVKRVVLEVDVSPGDESIAHELQLEPGEPVVKVVRLRTIDDKPFDICTNYLPAARFPGLEDKDLDSRSLYTILLDDYGVQFERGTRLIEASTCTPEEARLLHIKPRSPLLVMYSTMCDENGNVIEHGVVHQRSDTAQIVIEVLAR